MPSEANLGAFFCTFTIKTWGESWMLPNKVGFRTFSSVSESDEFLGGLGMFLDVLGHLARPRSLQETLIWNAWSACPPFSFGVSVFFVTVRQLPTNESSLGRLPRAFAEGVRSREHGLLKGKGLRFALSSHFYHLRQFSECGILCFCVSLLTICFYIFNFVIKSNTVVTLEKWRLHMGFTSIFNFRRPASAQHPAGSGTKSRWPRCS